MKGTDGHHWRGGWQDRSMLVQNYLEHWVSSQWGTHGTTRGLSIRAGVPPTTRDYGPGSGNLNQASSNSNTPHSLAAGTYYTYNSNEQPTAFGYSGHARRAGPS